MVRDVIDICLLSNYPGMKQLICGFYPCEDINRPHTKIELQENVSYDLWVPSNVNPS